MKSRDKINLTAQQSNSITEIHRVNAGEFTALTWDLDAANAKLKAILEETRPDPAAVQKQMDVVLRLENTLKKKQLSALVAIKNELTAKQQEELQILKDSGSSKAAAARSSKGSGALAMTLKSNNSGDKPTIYISTKDGLIEIEDLDKIKPIDIESLTVLKGQSAMDSKGLGDHHLYGSGVYKDGKNGVIIITLKDGAKYHVRE